MKIVDRQIAYQTDDDDDDDDDVFSVFRFCNVLFYSNCIMYVLLIHATLAAIPNKPSIVIVKSDSH